MIKNYSEMTKIPLKAKSLKLVSIGLSFHNSFFLLLFSSQLRGNSISDQIYKNKKKGEASMEGVSTLWAICMAHSLACRRHARLLGGECISSQRSQIPFCRIVESGTTSSSC
jgi:hypothetical protein